MIIPVKCSTVKKLDEKLNELLFGEFVLILILYPIWYFSPLYFLCSNVNLLFIATVLLVLEFLLLKESKILTKILESFFDKIFKFCEYIWIHLPTLECIKDE